MLMIVMSLAISLVSIQSLYDLSQDSSQSDEAQQEKRVPSHPTHPANVPPHLSVKPVELPAGANAWGVQIVSSGGYTGSGRGDLTLTSDGTMIWNGPDGSCSTKLDEEITESLANVILAADFSILSVVSPSGFCGDCYVTSMVVQHRRAAAVHVYRASWDDASQSKLPADVIAIYNSLMAHRGCKSQ